MAQQVQIKRLKVWYDEKNCAWPRWSKMIGFYKVEKPLVKGKPSYTSEHEDGKYAIWYDEKRKLWCLGRSSSRGKNECWFYARSKVKSGGGDICPTDRGHSMNTWTGEGVSRKSMLVHSRGERVKIG